MNLKDKLMGSISGIAEKLNLTNAELAKVIKENNEFIQAENKLTKESTEAIAALKVYASKETPALKDAFLSASSALENIEKNRSAMTKMNLEKFISPLNKLVEQWKQLNIEIKEDTEAQKKLDSAKKDLEKTKAKPAEKIKPGEIEQAEAKVNSCQDKAVKEHSDVVAATAKFTEAKVSTLKTALDDLIASKLDFYKKAIAELEATKKSVQKIDVQKEAEASADAVPAQ